MSTRKLLNILLLPMLLFISSVSWAASGDLIWDDEFNRQGARLDEANDVVVSGDMVYVVGRTMTAAGGTAFTVRAYDVAGDGLGGPDLIWADYHDKEGAGGDAAYGVDITGNTVIVVGRTKTVAGLGAWTVRAYDADDGTLLWDDEFDREGNGVDEALDVSISGNIAFVVGRTTAAAGGQAFTVRAYDVDGDGSGGPDVLWTDYYDEEGTKPDQASAVATDNNANVFAVGYAQTTAGGFGWLVRVYDKDGNLLWHDLFDRQNALLDKALSVDVIGDKTFVVGKTTTTAGGVAFSVRAYDSQGDEGGPDLTWADYYDAQGTKVDFARDVYVEDGRVHVVGKTTTSAGGGAFTVRSYDFNGDGLGGPDLNWADYFNREGTLVDEAFAVTGHGSKIFVVGITRTAAGGAAFSVRAYGLTGDGLGGPDLEWEDYYDAEGALFDDGRGVDASGNGVFAVGKTQTTAGGFAFTVRTFEN